jgi:hypothetical protein
MRFLEGYAASMPGSVGMSAAISTSSEMSSYRQVQPDSVDVLLRIRLEFRDTSAALESSGLHVRSVRTPIKEEFMISSDRIQLAKDFHDAFMSGDRTWYEEHPTDDLVFSSPVDVGLDWAGYFDRCWPGSGQSLPTKAQSLTVGEVVIQKFLASKTARSEASKYILVGIYQHAGAVRQVDQMVPEDAAS